MVIPRNANAIKILWKIWYKSAVNMEVSSRLKLSEFQPLLQFHKKELNPSTVN